MEIDWSKAPEGAEFYANGHFRKVIDSGCPYKWDLIKWVRGSWTSQECRECLDYSERQQQWPETDERIDRIGRDRTTEDMGHYDIRDKLDSIETHLKQPTEPKTAVEFLNACAAVQSERGKQYDASGTGERSRWDF